MPEVVAADIAGGALGINEKSGTGEGVAGAGCCAPPPESRPCEPFGKRRPAAAAMCVRAAGATRAERSLRVGEDSVRASLVVEA